VKEGTGKEAQAKETLQIFINKKEPLWFQLP
jgi:hypothetical protein